jgi:peptidoglycan-associated lipoprotein
MFYKILLSIFLAVFITACSTTPKDTSDASGSGSSGSSESVDSSDDSSDSSSSANDSTSDEIGIEPGSQEDLIVNVGDRVFFAYNSAELDADAQELLQDQVAWFKQHNILKITIEGHCDERGTREYNLALGEKRAQAVKNYLNGLSVFPVINTISYGKERPAVIGSNDGAWSQNRRSVTTVN